MFLSFFMFLLVEFFSILADWDIELFDKKGELWEELADSENVGFESVISFKFDSSILGI